MFCQKCGKQNSTEASFCVGCGSPMGGEVVAGDSPDTIVLKPNRSKKIILSALVVCLIAAAGFYFLVSKKQNEVLSDAVNSCKVGGQVHLAEDHKSLTFDGSPNDDYVGLRCILTALKAPSTILDRMSNTTALMGSVSGNWSGISVSWTYHPDNGLDCYFELTS
jgi:hypothetical protein